jgi:hypothetical protein
LFRGVVLDHSRPTGRCRQPNCFHVKAED